MASLVTHANSKYVQSQDRITKLEHDLLNAHTTVDIQTRTLEEEKRSAKAAKHAESKVQDKLRDEVRQKEEAQRTAESATRSEANAEARVKQLEIELQSRDSAIMVQTKQIIDQRERQNHICQYGRAIENERTELVKNIDLCLDQDRIAASRYDSEVAEAVAKFKGANMIKDEYRQECELRQYAFHEVAEQRRYFDQQSLLSSELSFMPAY